MITHETAKTFEHEGETYTRAGDGTIRNRRNEIVELYEGRYQKVIDARRSGWWRYHGHYDRHGYCDNPGRGY